MSDLPSDFRQQQHCIKPSLSPGGAGGGEEGLMPPHMGEYGMGEEHKDDGYGGPEMGSWQMPGRFFALLYRGGTNFFTVNSPPF